MKATDAASLLVKKLLPIMPVRVKGGKQVRILPVCFIQNVPGEPKPMIVWAVPEDSQPVEIPELWHGFKTRQKEWEGAAPAKVQKLARQIFMERK